MFEIKMVEFNSEEFIPETEGKYLVRTVSTSHLKSVQFIQVRVSKVWNEKKKKEVCSIDINNQIVTHISTKPII